MDALTVVLEIVVDLSCVKLDTGGQFMGSRRLERGVEDRENMGFMPRCQITLNG